MKLLDLKYLLVKNPEGKVAGFSSFMPTYEDGYAVVYCYEIHLGLGLQGFVITSISVCLLLCFGTLSSFLCASQIPNQIAEYHTVQV